MQEKIREQFHNTFDSWQNLLKESTEVYDLLNVKTRVKEDLDFLLNSATSLIDRSTETIQEIDKYERSAKRALENMRSCIQSKRESIKRFKMNIFARLNKRRLKKRIDVLQRKLLEKQNRRRDASKEIKFGQCLLMEVLQESEMVQLQIEEKTQQSKIFFVLL